MAQTSIGFNGSINAAQWAAKGPLLLDGRDCVGAPGHAVVTSPTGIRAVDVAAGDIAGDAVVTTLSASERIALPTPTNGQWFLLVLNRVWATSTTSLMLRNGATTSATFGFLPPASFPASTTTNPGTNSDIPIAWLWANSSSTNVYIFPLLRPTENAYPNSGTAAVRSAVLGAQAIAAPIPWNQYWGQNYLPMWYDTALSLFTTYQASYDATNNANGVQGAPAWLPVSDLANPLRYGSEVGLKSGASMTTVGDGQMGYARDTQGLYYRRNDGRTVRLDSDIFVVVEFSGSMAGDGGSFRTMGPVPTSSLRRYSTSDADVFPVRTDGVIGPIAVPGWYEVSANVTWDSNLTNGRILRIMQNDDDVNPAIGDRRTATGETATSLGGIMTLSAGDFIKLKGSQDSGVSLGYSGRLTARLLRPNNV